MIDANARRIYELLDSHGGHIYVCGDFYMANDVKSVIVSIFQEYGNINADEAASAVENLIVSFSIRYNLNILFHTAKVFHKA